MEKGKPSQRMVVSEDGLLNWYKVLFNCVNEKIEIKPDYFPYFCELEKDLFKILHFHPRDDNFLVTGLMKVWGFCHSLNNQETFDQISFEQLLENVFWDEKDFLNSIAILVSRPVNIELIPVNYRTSAPLQYNSSNVCELSMDGIMKLFATWHCSILKQIILNFDLCFKEIGSINIAEKYVPESVTLTSQQIKRLDMIHGCLYIPSVDIYSVASEINTYLRLKKSSLNSEDQYEVSAKLFDYDPSHYLENILGTVLNLAKKYSIQFCYSDELLYSTGKCLWLWSDADRNLIALVNNKTIHFLYTANREGIINIASELEEFCNR